ncbi:MAG: PAS domain S-box protein [Ignavibacteriales bacterium]
MSESDKIKAVWAESAWRETDRNLRKQIDYLNTLIDNLNEIFYTYDADGIITFGNQKTCDSLGFKLDELIGRHILDFVPLEDRGRVRQEMAKRLIGGEPGSYEQRVNKKNGNLCLFRLNVSPIKEDGKIVGGMVLAEDITERAEAEEALRVSEEKFSRAFHSSAQVVTLNAAKNGRYIDVNDSFVELSGFSAEEAIGRTTEELGMWVYPEERRQFIENLWQERSVRNFEMSFKDRWGGIRVTLLSADIIIIDGEDVILGVTNDISVRKKMEQDLAAEKERLAVTLGSIAEGVIAANDQGEVVLINEIAETLIDWPNRSAIGQQLSDVFKVSYDLHKEGSNLVKTVLNTKKVLDLNECILQGKDKQNLVLSLSAAPMKDISGGIVGVVLVFRDVTDKKRIDQELQKAGKLESLGVLAGGIAHDFNNLLTIILGNSTLIRELASGQDSILEYLNEIEKGTSQARSLTQQLLTFARGGDPVKQTVYLADLVGNTATFALSGSNVRADFDLPSDLWPVDIDEGQIGQVINNLVLNATQAMPNGGLINIKAWNEVITENSDLPLANGKYIRLSIKDRGVGIQEELKSKIFDPYFTTKSSGSGLGLATSYSIIKNHKGYISVDSVVGEGSTFFVYLPVAGNQTEKVKKVEKGPVLGQGRVLVMDDDRQVLDVLGRMLCAIGYETVMTADGSEAIDKYLEALTGDQAYDVVVLDLTVPGGMGGGETIIKLREIDPNIKAIVSSGYCNDKIMAEFDQWGFKGVLPKPYGIKDLSEVLSRVIRGDNEERISDSQIE